jgi:hypothetical protein
VSIIGTESYACTYLFDFAVCKDGFLRFYMSH